MAKLEILKGSTSQSVDIFIQDSTVTTGAGKTGLAFNTSSLTAYYHRIGSSATAITLVTQTVNGAYSSGGFVEVDATNMPGIYRLDIPDAALATGVRAVVILLKGATGMAPCPLEIQLTGTDNQDAVRGGMTALPNANAGANGGLPTGDASGRVDVSKIAGTSQTARDIGASVLISSGSGTGQLDVSGGVIKANLAQILGTALTETAGQIAAAFKQFFNIASPTSTMNTITTVTNLTTNNDKTGYSLTTLESQILQSGTAQAGASGSITLASGASSTNSLYIGEIIKIYGGTGAGQVRVITAYNGTSKVATVGRNWTTAPDNTSTYAVLALSVPKVDDSLQVTVGAVANDAITAAAIAADAIGASELAADAVTEIQSAILSDATPFPGANINASISSRSTYAGGDTSGTTTLLSRLSAARAGYLDNLSAGAVALASSILDASGIRSAVGLASANLDTQIGTLATPAQVKTQVVAALATDTYAEPGQGAPAATATLAVKIGYVYKAWRNQKKQTSSTFSLYADDATTVDQKATVSDDGTTTTIGEIATGP